MRTILTLLCAATLAGCGQDADPAPIQPRALAAAPTQGQTYDNPFGIGGNETATDAAVAAEVPADEVAEAGTTQDPETGGYSPMPDAATGRSCDDGKRVCRDMDSCEDAMFHLQQCGMTRLDGDSDGSPCEKLCGQGS